MSWSLKDILIKIYKQNMHEDTMIHDGELDEMLNMNDEETEGEEKDSEDEKEEDEDDGDEE